MRALRAPVAVVVSALIAAGVAQVWPGAAAPVGAACGALGLLATARVPAQRVVLSTALAALAALALRWAVMVTMTPAYPDRAAALAGAAVAASAAGLVVWWVSRDLRAPMVTARGRAGR